MANGDITLKQYLKNRLEEYPNAYQMAVQNDWSFGLVYRCLNGGDSPTLRKQIGVRKWPKRDGIFISCTLEIKARFDHQRGPLSRREYLERLLDLDCGIGEVV